MKKYKTLITISTFVIVMTFLGFLFFRDTSGYTTVSNQNSLSKNRNEYAFINVDYEKYSTDYLIKQAEYITPYLNYILDENSNVIDLEEISSDKLIFILNILLSGANENICYEKEFLDEKLFDVFGIENNSFAIDSPYYNYYENKFCFEELFLNGEVKAKAENTSKNGDLIYINIKETEYKRWQVVYKKIDNKVFLNKFIIL